MTLIQQYADERKERLARLNGQPAAELRRKLAISLEEQGVFITRFPSQWNLTPVQALFIIGLAASPGGFATYETLAQVCRLRGNTLSTIRVHAYSLRKLLEDEGIVIKTWRMQGFALTKGSMAKLREMAKA